MTAVLIQSSFQFGEVSPLLHARVDSPIFYKAVKRLRNMLVIPQGGATRRFGTTFVDQINNHAGSPTYLTDYTQVKGFIFDYENGDRYLLIFRENAIDVYYNNVYQSTTVTTYAAADIEALSIAQSVNIIFIAHSSYAPRTLIRASVGPVVLTLSTPTFINYPTFDFKQNYAAAVFAITDGANTGIGNLTTAQNLLGRVVSLNASAALFSADYEGGLFIAEGGILRLVTFNLTTRMTARIIQTFDTTSALFDAASSFAINGKDSILTEKAFSTTRGFPGKVGFFQNRLFYGKTTSLPGGLWGSNYAGYNATQLNFDDSNVLDTGAISTVIQGTKATVIEHLVGFKSLVVFTSSGLYSTPLLSNQPLTPSNIAFVNLQTSDATNDVVPLVFDNDVIFFDSGGKKVKNINVFATTQTYETRNISVLASHLIDQPYSAAVFENSSVQDGNWMFMVNSGDTLEGSMAVYQSVPEQDIVAWSLSTPAPTEAELDYFRHVISDQETVYFIVQRTVNGNVRLFIEQLSFDAFMDCSTVGTQALSNVISGLTELEGETVTVLGKISGSTGLAVVDTTGPVTGGTVTLAKAVTDYQVGLFWSPELVPLAMNFPVQNGNNYYMPKSIKKIFIDFYESSGIYMNDTLIPPFRFDGDDTYDNPAIPQTDYVQMEPMGGWNPSTEISFTQQQPLPMTLLGIGFVVTT